MLVSVTKMLDDAQRGQYAVGQFNINNLEWVKAILKAGQKMASPLILGVTESAACYMGGLGTVRMMVEGMIRHLRIDIPVGLHLDHSGFELCLQAIGAGFSSVMFDGSKMPFQENLALCGKLAKICHEKDISLEAELGSPAGEEDNISGTGEKALPSQCEELAKSGISMLAAAIGNMHGVYPDNWTGLDLKLLQEIAKVTHNLPLVLHGGSGIPDAMIRQAIKMGICKINVNTECQIAFANATRQYFDEDKDREEKGYMMQKLLRPGMDAVTETVMDKIKFFGSQGKVTTICK